MSEAVSGAMSGAMSGAVIHAGDGDFDEVVLHSQTPVLVDFSGSHCPPCARLAPIIRSLAEKYAGRAKVVEVSTDDNFEVVSRYMIRSVPTVLFFDAGKVVGQLNGLRPRDAYEGELDRLLR